VDEKSGIVHIPIDRAMELLAQRGLPTRRQAMEAAVVKQAKGKAASKE
jgi:hypothetical protein